jgi:AAA ATPase domain
VAERPTDGAPGSEEMLADIEVEAEISLETAPGESARDGKDLPYPGLRSFRPDEEDIFFGRDAALDAMAERLGQTKFLAVLGPSGCGKSSLVKTGLYTTLRLGLLPNAGGRWRIAELCPGHRPIWNLARGLLKARVDKPDDWEPEAEAVEQIAEHLRRGPRSVIELAEDSMLEDGRNLLLVIDQFEELFRFRDYSGREEAEAFVALLLESARSELPIHVIITMRSEYLGACSLMPGLAEQVSDGMFLTPRMTRDECRAAIEEPARVRDFDIEPALIARILNDLQIFAPFDQSDGIDQAERLSLQADQLPLMQHLLNRMWRQARAEGRPGRLVLTLHDYEEAGCLTGALDAHGKEILKDLVERGGAGIEATVENVFRALVEGPSVPLAVRSPQPFGRLVAAAGGEEKRAEVEMVVEAFRGPDCNFLRTSEQALGDEVIVDIGHESLIRRWTHLRQWFEAEVECRAMWLRLSQDAQLEEAKKCELLRDLGLAHATGWWDREQPTDCIARRYGGDFEKTKAFLDKSAAAEKRRLKWRRIGRWSLAGGALLLIALLFVWLGWLRQQNAQLDQLRQRAERSEAGLRRQAALDQAQWRRYTETRSAFRDFLGRRYCGRYVASSQSYLRCVDERIAILLEDYHENYPERRERELPMPMSGAAGGVVR